MESQQVGNGGTQRTNLPLLTPTPGMSGNQPKGDTMNTAHKAECARVFKRYDPTCPRCQELARGQAPRAGWNDLAKRNEAQRTQAIRNHDFAACAKRHIACTCFDY